MEKSKNIILVVSVCTAVALVVGISGFFYGRNTKEAEIDNDQAKITNQIVVDKITDQYFVVTKSIFLDQKTEIIIRENSDWSDLLWKNTVNAEGLVRIDVGVDLQDLESDDVKVNSEEKEITITIPKAEILDASLYSELEVESQSGVITSIQKLFEDGTDDYNLAVSVLVGQGSDAVNNNLMILTEAQEESTKIIRLILSETGYKLIFEFE
jgi:hypothetical protein